MAVMSGQLSSAGEVTRTASPEIVLAPLDKHAIVVGGILFAVLMALSARYGYDRDELYFLDCARHLQASYVDQPVLTPLIARLSLALFGVSEAGLRLWPALAGWATVVIGGLTAREFGGSRRAHRVDVQDQPGARRVAGMAAAREHGAGRVDVAASQPAGQCRDLHQRLWRGGRDQ